MENPHDAQEDDDDIDKEQRALPTFYECLMEYEATLPLTRFVDSGESDVLQTYPLPTFWFWFAEAFGYTMKKNGTEEKYKFFYSTMWKFHCNLSQTIIWAAKNGKKIEYEISIKRMIGLRRYLIETFHFITPSQKEFLSPDIEFGVLNTEKKDDYPYTHYFTDDYSKIYFCIIYNCFVGRLQWASKTEDEQIYYYVLDQMNALRVFMQLYYGVKMNGCGEHYMHDFAEFGIITKTTQESIPASEFYSKKEEED